MGLFDRMILTIYTFTLAFLALVAMALSFHAIPLETIWTGLSFLYGRWETAFVAALYFLISVRLMLAGIEFHHEKKAIVHHNELGNVHISLQAIERLMEKTARNMRGVRAVKAQVYHGKEGIQARIRVTISPESSVPDVSEQIQKKMQEYTQKTVGIELTNVQIVVDAISNEFSGKTKNRLE